MKDELLKLRIEYEEAYFKKYDCFPDVLSISSKEVFDWAMTGKL